MFAGSEILYRLAQDVENAESLENRPYLPMYPRTVVMPSKMGISSRRENRNRFLPA